MGMKKAEVYPTKDDQPLFMLRTVGSVLLWISSHESTRHVIDRHSLSFISCLLVPCLPASFWILL